MISTMFISASVLSVIVGLLALALGSTAGIFIAKIIDKQDIKKSKKEALKVLEEAYAEAKTAKKEATLAAKEEMQNLKDIVEKEVAQRRSEVQKMEVRLAQREEFIDKKELNLDKKFESIEEQKKELNTLKTNLEKRIAEQEEIKEKIIRELEKVSSLSKAEAKSLLIKEITDDARKDAVKFIADIEEKAKEQADKKAQYIVSMAIQKCATDVTSETTVSTITVPEEMKGRIIGREGRNIKAFENAMGVDLIIDDTPETISISCFDPIRREIARISLEKLIMDGRIHPSRIEEIVNKVTKDVQNNIKQTGENAAEQAGVFNLHPELIKYLGKLKFRTSYGQNCLQHSLETSFIAGLLASEVGANVKIAKRGGLLHDIGKALDHEVEGTHISLGVDVAKKYKEHADIVHCIESHHFGVEFRSIEAILVQVADAISSSRPGARRETLENYVKRLENLEKIANSFRGVEKSYALQAGREVRIIVKPNEVSDKIASFMAKDIAKKIEEEMEYPGQIKVNVIRESRYTETAK